MDLSALERIFRMPHYANLETDQLGLDSREHCLDPCHYDRCSPVTYRFNELGYRMESIHTFTGREILAIGDSFTLGLGADIQDTWPSVLSRQLDRTVLNFSLNGASNRWMCRRLRDLLDFFQPPLVIVHYSFSHRRENDRTDWFDDERTLSTPSPGSYLDYEDWRACSQQIQDQCKCPVIESFIPRWHEQPTTYTTNQVPPIHLIDRARDGFHYGPLSHALLAQELYRQITNLPVFL